MKRHTKSLMGLAAVVMLLAAYSPASDFIPNLQQKLKSFYESKNRTSIHLILSQPEYVAGDTAYFKAHLLEGSPRRPASGKLILNLQLLNVKQEILIHHKMVCLDGTATGQLALPAKLEPGAYALIAFVDNNGDVSTRPAVFQTELLIGGDKLSTKAVSEIELFPEGGKLIAGVKTKVVARIPGPPVTARVLDLTGKEIAEFTTQPSGFGTFYVTPQEGQRFVVEATIGRKALPEIVSDGVGISLEPMAEAKSMRVTLRVPDNSRFRQEESYLILSAQGAIGYSKTISFQKDPEVTLSVPGMDGTEGIARLTVFSGQGDMLTESLVFLDARPVDLHLTVDAIDQQIRRPVKLDVNLSDFRGLPVAANLSLSVYNEALFTGTGPKSDFRQNVLLFDELAPDFLPAPAIGELSPADLSDYLITRKWGTFQWKEVLDYRQEKNFKPSSTSYFTAKIISRKGKTIPDSTAVTFYLNRNDFIYVVYSRHDGEIRFPLFMDFGNDELYYTIFYHGKVNKDAFLSLPASPSMPWPLPVSVPGKEADPYFTFSKAKAPIVKAFQYYLSKSPGANKGKSRENEYAEFVDVDVDADITKYKKFGSMAEVLIEVVPALKNRKVDGREVVRVFMQERAMYTTDDPLFFVDGVITDSTAYFMSLDPNYISRVKLLRSEKTLARFGDLGRNGIVVVETKTPEKANLIPRSRKTLQITGVSPAVPFHSPVYNTDVPAFVPDLRSTLTWQPNLKVDREGKTTTSFYTGDATGVFIVRVEGMTVNGQPFSGQTRVTVSMGKP